jgi:nucleoside-diphosphate-sugar epimerase
MRILVTGGAGYLGSILCEHLLTAGQEVMVVDNLTYGSASLFHLTSNPKFHFIKGDVRDIMLMSQAIQQVDVIMPLAAIVGAPACVSGTGVSEAINYTSVTTVARYASKDQLIIFPTTNSGYGTQKEGVVCTENTRLTPISLYGKTKADAEAYLLNNHLNTITLRLATVFGCSPRMRLDLLVNDFTYRAVTDGYIALYEPDFVRNYVHIRDVADCFIHCLEHAEHMIGRAYNVGLDSANISKGDLAEKIKQHVPKFDISYVVGGQDPDKRNYTVSNQRLREAGFEARRTLDQGIDELLKGYSMMGRRLYHNV